MKCINHPEKEASGLCNLCAKPICEECAVKLKEESYCKACLAVKMGEVKKQEHSPALAAILSFIIAGLGQVYNGQVGKALLIFFTSWLIIPWIIGIFDAYITAKKISSGEIAFRKKTGCLIAMIISIFIFWIMVFILAMLAAIAIPNFLRARLNANEEAAKATLKSISIALETYAQQNNQIYPISEASLTGSNPPYLTSSYNKKKAYGYTFSEDLKTSGYVITATPDECGVSGNKIFSVETNSKFSENRCRRDVSGDSYDAPYYSHEEAK